MTEEERVGQYFAFLTQKGWRYERDYSKQTDSTCTQIYRFRKDAGNYVEFRVLTEKERNTLVCVNGEKRFPNLMLRYAKFVRGWKRKRLFSAERKDIWLLTADLCRHVTETEGTLFGISL